MEWTVRFNEYTKFEGVKESINYTKRKAKLQKKTNPFRAGDMVEESIKTIIEDGGVMTVDTLPPQYDMGFGADFKFNYKKEEKNYSFFVDVTAKTDPSMRYFGLHGELVDSLSDAFCYYTDEFSLFFSVKYNHHGFFFYEKPVISLVVKGFGEKINLENVDLSHGTNISNVLIALHEHLCDEGYGARASHYVRPNKSRFYGEYKKYRRGVVSGQKNG